MIFHDGPWKQATDGDVRCIPDQRRAHPLNSAGEPQKRAESLAFPGDVVRFLRSMPDGAGFLFKLRW